MDAAAAISSRSKNDVSVTLPSQTLPMDAISSRSKNDVSVTLPSQTLPMDATSNNVPPEDAATTNNEVSMEIEIEIPPLIRRYKDGRIERLFGTAIVPPSLHDPATGVSSKDVVIHPDTGLSARIYLPVVTGVKKKLPVVVYYHGGGFCIESAFSSSYQYYANSLANKAGVLVVSVDYRLAPEHPIPAAYDDAWRALQWVAAASGDEWLVEHADLSRVFLAGDSAGGNIVHNVAMRAGGEEEDGLTLKLKGAVLVHPYFWSTKRIGREAEERETFLTVAAVDPLWPFVNPGEAGEKEEDPRLNPLAEGAPSLAGLRCERMLVLVAGKDLLADRGRAYCEGVKGSGWGGEVEVVVSEEEDHVFHLFNPGCEKATEMMERLVAFINH